MCGCLVLVLNEKWPFIIWSKYFRTMPYPFLFRLVWNQAHLNGQYQPYHSCCFPVTASRVCCRTARLHAPPSPLVYMLNLHLICSFFHKRLLGTRLITNRLAWGLKGFAQMNQSPPPLLFVFSLLSCLFLSTTLMIRIPRWTEAICTVQETGCNSEESRDSKGLKSE